MPLGVDNNEKDRDQEGERICIRTPYLVSLKLLYSIRSRNKTE